MKSTNLDAKLGVGGKFVSSLIIIRTVPRF